MDTYTQGHRLLCARPIQGIALRPASKDLLGVVCFERRDINPINPGSVSANQTPYSPATRLGESLLQVSQLQYVNFLSKDGPACHPSMMGHSGSEQCSAKHLKAWCIINKITMI